METKFITGQQYAVRSNCDHNMVFSFTVIRRTAKTVWLKGPYAGDKIASFRISADRGAEEVSPHGRHSMAPILSARGLV